MSTFIPENHEASGATDCWLLSDGTTLAYEGIDSNNDIVFTIDGAVSPKALNAQQFHDTYAPMMDGDTGFSDTDGEDPVAEEAAEETIITVDQELLQDLHDALAAQRDALVCEEQAKAHAKECKATREMADKEVVRVASRIDDFASGGVPDDAPLFTKPVETCGTCGNMGIDDDYKVPCCDIKHDAITSESPACEDWTDQHVEEEPDPSGEEPESCVTDGPADEPVMDGEDVDE